jgi:hypothetical protein
MSNDGVEMLMRKMGQAAGARPVLLPSGIEAFRRVMPAEYDDDAIRIGRDELSSRGRREHHVPAALPPGATRLGVPIPNSQPGWQGSTLAPSENPMTRN